MKDWISIILVIFAITVSSTFAYSMGHYNGSAKERSNTVRKILTWRKEIERLSEETMTVYREEMLHAREHYESLYNKLMISDIQSNEMEEIDNGIN